MLYILVFMLGGLFGGVMMCLLTCSGDLSREEEKNEQDNI